MKDTGIDDNSLDYTAQLINEAFIAKLSSSKDSKYVNADSVSLVKACREAAAICRKIGADPKQYVDAIYWKHRKTGFFASMLHCRNAESIFLDFLDVLRMETELTVDKTFEAQKRVLSNGIRLAKRDPEKILLDNSLNLSPWFRCTITVDPIPEVMEKYGKLAKSQINSFPEVKKLIIAKGLDLSRFDNI